MVRKAVSSSCDDDKEKFWRTMPVWTRTIALMLITAVVTTQLVSTDHVPRTDCGFSLMDSYSYLLGSSTNGSASNDDVAVALPHRNNRNNNDDFQLARDQSYGFFDDIPSRDWKLYQQRARTHANHEKPGRPNGRWPRTQPSVFYMSNYDPLFTCPHERRLGGAGDGPKWTCDPHRLIRISKERKEQARAQAQQQLQEQEQEQEPSQLRVLAEGDTNRERHKAHLAATLGKPPSAETTAKPQTNCLVYSIGCAGKYQWEEGLAQALMVDDGGDGNQQQRACEIHVFDFSKNYTVPGHAEKYNIHFHQWGLKSSYDKTLETSVLRPPMDRMFTLQETIEKLGHQNHVIDIFKIDCEFCEWFTYKDWLTNSVEIRQLLIETHNLPNPGENPHQNKGGSWFPATIKLAPSQFFDDIQQAGFAMYSKEANIHPNAMGNGIEFAYIKLHPDFFKADN